MRNIKINKNGYYDFLISEAFNINDKLYNFMSSMKDTRIQLVRPLGIANYNKQMQGYGLYSLEPIKKGETIISVARDMCIDGKLEYKHESQKTIDKLLGADEFPKTPLHAKLLRSLATTLKLHTLKLSKGLHKDYISSFPFLLPTPCRWSQNLLTDIDSKSIYRSIGQTKSFFESYLELLNRNSVNISYDEFIWAHEMVLSRSLPANSDDKNANNEFIIAPLIDYINHSYSPNVDWRLDNENTQQGNTKVITVFATKDIECSSQLYFNYSCRTNLHYCIKYGFVPYKPIGIEFHLDHTSIKSKIDHNKSMKNILFKTFNVQLESSVLTLKQNQLSHMLTFARIANISDTLLLTKGVNEVENADYSKPLPAKEEIDAVDSVLDVFIISLRALSKDYHGMLDKLDPIANKNNYDTYNMLRLHEEEKQLLTYYTQKLSEHKKKIQAA